MITFDDANLSGRNPQIVADLRSLADGWKVVADELPEVATKKPARKRAAAAPKRATKPKS